MISATVKKEIQEMNLEEKLSLVEAIWDSIAEGNATLPFPEWQRKELDKRYSEYKKGNLKLEDWKKVHREIKAK